MANPTRCTVAQAHRGPRTHRHIPRVNNFHALSVCDGQRTAGFVVEHDHGFFVFAREGMPIGALGSKVEADQSAAVCSPREGVMSDMAHAPDIVGSNSLLDLAAPINDDHRPMPVELLRDERGIYGIGVADQFDYEAVAWSCGIEHALPNPSALILRPDRFLHIKPHAPVAALQKIVGGFRHGPFMRSSEETLRKFIHHEVLNRIGLSWPPPQDQAARWWATDKRQQAHNRGIYHGLRKFSLHVINDLIDKALEEAADGTALKAARRFTFIHRERIYRAAALSRRALQLAETFPVLAMVIYSDHWRLRPHIDGPDWFARVHLQQANFAERQVHAAHLVERGARLRDVARAINIPMTLRRIKPGVAHLASDLFCNRPDLLCFLPDSTSQQRIWLLVVNWACGAVDADFGAWVARHVAEIPGRRVQAVGSFISDLSDWARPDIAGRQFGKRPFESSMSLRTVTALSAEWHEAVAANMNGPDVAFPTSWYPAAKVAGYDVLPIDNSANLYREGAAMHHCVGTYADRVRQGEVQVYSVRRDGERLATFSLARSVNSVKLIELRGPCNVQPAKAISAVVQRWLRAQAPLPRSKFEESRS